MTPRERSLLKDYFVASGLQLVRGNEDWALLQGVLESVGEVEFLLPGPGNESDQGKRSFQTALEALCLRFGESYDEVRFRITGVNRDLHTCKVGEGDFIPFKVASSIPKALRKLITYAYAAEHKLQPHYTETHFGNALALRGYEFGHTIRGSYVFTLRSSLHDSVRTVGYTADPAQIPLPFEDEDLVTRAPQRIMPITRRISERITRSLDLVAQVAQRDDISELVHSYPQALNANMGDALASLLEDADAPVTFKTIWAPKLGIPEDFPETPVQAIRPGMKSVIERASRDLREHQPEIIEAVAVVRGMESNAPPHLEEADRMIYVLWLNHQPRPVSMRIDISRPDWYQSAQRAHYEWKSVRVVGTLHEHNGRYHMTDVQSFVVAGD